MPADIEVVHAYYVHPVGYWVERPVEIHTRVIEVDRITEVTRVRDIQRKHEGPRFVEVDRVETSVTIERRQSYYENVTVERQRLVVERTERASAVAEHRPPRIPDTERAEARAIVTKARAEGKATTIQANANAKAEVTTAKADARAEQIKSRADSKAELTQSRTESKVEKNQAHADANAKVTEARGDAKVQKIDSNAKVTDARAESKVEKIDSKAKVSDARAESKTDKIASQTKVAEAKADAKVTDTHARADAKATETQVRADARDKERTAGRMPSPHHPARPTAEAPRRIQGAIPEAAERPPTLQPIPGVPVFQARRERLARRAIRVAGVQRAGAAPARQETTAAAVPAAVIRVASRVMTRLPRIQTRDKIN